MATYANSRTAAGVLRPVYSDPPLEAYLLPLSGFPAPEEEMAPLRNFLVKFTGNITHAWGLSLELILEFWQLKRDGARILSSHGRAWKPATGMGVWPGREPPKLWTPEDFKKLEPGQLPPPVSYTVFRITADAKTRVEVLETMAGLGSTIQVLVTGDATAYLKAAKDLLLPPIQESAFRFASFYIPLIESKSFEAAAPAMLDQWLCGATVYIRESVEDSGILIISQKSLNPILESLGARYEPEPIPQWRLPE